MYLENEKYPKSERLYLIYASAFVVILVLTNIIGIKLFHSPFTIGEYLFGDSMAGFDTLTTGIITYPLTFLITDVVSEIWGAKRASFMVIVGFGMSILMLILVQIAVALPASPYWVPPPVNDIFAYGYSKKEDYQNAYLSVFSANSKLLFGSMLAYMFAQLLDVRLYHFWRGLTNGKHLWLRNNGSTMISQLFDTAIVNSILFYWAFGWDFWSGVKVMIMIYIYKMMLAVIDTPLIYLFVAWNKKILGLNKEKVAVS